MITSLRKIIRLTLTDFCHRQIFPRTLQLFQRPTQAVEDLEVHTLASEKTFDGAMLAFISLEHHSDRRWKFIFHEDGTLKETHREKLLKIFPDAVWISRKHADERVEAHLSRFPLSHAHRSRHNLAMKFFDPPLFSEKARWLLLDSDVVFFQRPFELLSWASQNSNQCFYNQDTREKFCMPRAMIEKKFPCCLPPLFNSGLIFYPGPSLALERTEDFLSRCEKDAHAPQFVEQTLWAMAAGDCPGGAHPLPRTYNVSWGYWREPGSITRHYVGAFKHDLLYLEGATLLLKSLITARLNDKN